MFTPKFSDIKNEDGESTGGNYNVTAAEAQAAAVTLAGKMAGEALPPSTSAASCPSASGGGGGW